MNLSKKLAFAAVLAALAFGSVGCTRHVSRDISDDGQHVGKVIFPSLDRIVLKEGTFPTREALTQIGPGASKDQLYKLIGRPHFREGFGHVTEWDYLFRFRTGADVTSCRYKVIFDKHEKAQSFHWLPEACVAMAMPVDAAKRFTLSTDAMFGFGRSSFDDMQPDAQAELASIAKQIGGARASLVKVIGYTDRIGDERSNLELSRRRAETVREFLIANGVPAGAIVAVGMGERDPATTCSDALAQADRVACLQPDRRVEIVVSALG